MRNVFFVLGMLLVSGAFGQRILPNEQTNAFLNWLVKKDHLKLLNAKTDLSTFYGPHTDVLKVRDLLSDSINAAAGKCLQDFMTDDEVRAFHLKLKRLKEVKWKNTGYVLPARYYTDISHQTVPNITDSTNTYYGLSLPVFLNKDRARVLIGEYFTADMAFGRGEVLLFEYKNGQWRTVARVVTWNS